MRVFRASRRPRRLFNPLDASPSVAREGWRFNDRNTQILYAAEVEALAVLEVVARPGWESVEELSVAMIEIPDGAVVGLAELELSLPATWNQRPAARDPQRIGRQFLTEVDARRAQGEILCGVRVPSVISSTDHNVLLDPRQKARYAVTAWSRIPFDWLRSTAT